jgi:hypothetical protein
MYSKPTPVYRTNHHNSSYYFLSLQSVPVFTRSADHATILPLTDSLDFVFGQRISISQLFNLSIGMALLQLIRRS